MGLFDFFGKKTTKKTDIIWLNQEAKMNGVLDIISQNPDANLVAWSPLTKNLYEQATQKELGIKIEVKLAQRVSSFAFKGEVVYFLEHHLFYSPEAELIEHWQPQKVIFLGAMDDHVLEPAISSRITTMMERMGMEENESIEHGMVSKSIQRVQQEFEEELDVFALPPQVKRWFDTFWR